jgi:hypothetical protein
MRNYHFFASTVEEWHMTELVVLLIKTQGCMHQRKQRNGGPGLERNSQSIKTLEKEGTWDEVTVRRRRSKTLAAVVRRSGGLSLVSPKIWETLSTLANQKLEF